MIAHCPACGKKNRTDPGRAGVPHCGSCGAALADRQYDVAAGREVEKWRGRTWFLVSLLAVGVAYFLVGQGRGWLAIRAYREAVVMADSGRHDEAVERYATSLKLNSNDAITHYAMGLSYLRLGHLDQAELHFDRALVLQPGYVDASRMLTLTRTALASRY